MTTQIDVINMAYLRLGIQNINSLSDNTQFAYWANLLWQPTYQQALFDAAPSFARRQMQLALRDESPLFGYTYSYTMPDNIIRCLAINEDQFNMAIPADWGQFGVDEWKVCQNEDGEKVIYANVNPLQIEVITDESNVGVWNVGFIRIVETLLASKLAFPARADLMLEQTLYKEYEDQLAKQSGVDSTQGSHERIQASAFTEVR